MKKRMLSTIITVTMMFALVGCGNTKDVSVIDSTSDMTSEITTEVLVADNDKTTEQKTTEGKKTTEDKTTEVKPEKPTKPNANSNTSSSNSNSGSSSNSNGNSNTSSNSGSSQSPSKPPTQPSTQAPSTQAPSKPPVQPSTQAPAPTPTCQHDWKEIMTTVHHDAVYDYVYHPPVFYDYFCYTCNQWMPTQDGCSNGSTGHHLVQAEWEEQVLVSAAWDEQVGTGHFQCTKCGAKK